MFQNHGISQDPNVHTRLIGGQELRCQIHDGASGVFVVLTPATQEATLSLAEVKPLQDKPLEKPSDYQNALFEGARSWVAHLNQAEPVNATNAKVIRIREHVAIGCSLAVDRFRSALEFLPSELEYAFSADAREEFKQKQLAKAVKEQGSQRPAVANEPAIPATKEETYATTAAGGATSKTTSAAGFAGKRQGG